MPQCGICLEQIGLIYYKSNCDCKIVYHYPCIIDWYKIKKQCILCKCKGKKYSLFNLAI